MEIAPSPHSSLSDFIHFLFEGLQGITYVSVKDPEPYVEDGVTKYHWEQHYFNYPAESSRMETVIHSASIDNDVYLSPVVYSKPDFRLENVRGSNVLWTEFDGNAPLSYTNEPSLRVRSSGAANEHVYWRLTEPIYDVTKLQDLNRAITYSMGADSSAWDATQILRPPETQNFKYDPPLPVTTISHKDIKYTLDVFNAIPSAPEPISADWEPSSLPAVAEVILKYAFTKQAAELFSKPKLPDGERSSGLMQLAYFGCEMGMSNEEIFSVLLNADDRWKKFVGRRDRIKRLSHIITVARNKHPGQEDTGDDDTPFFMFDFVSFINTQIDIDWVVEGMLMENGTMLMTGPSGIGKTQITMRFAMHLAMGKPIWHYTIPKKRKILFLSLEMGHGELKVFANAMAQGLDASELALLEENFIVIPHGEKWPLNKPEGQQMLINVVEAIKPDGIVIDSVGSALAGSINNDEHVQDLVDFNDRLRKKYNLFLWYIHHMRKSTNGGGAPTSQDDIYGNQYIVNRASSAYGVLKGKDGKIKIRNFKNRLSTNEDDYLVERVDGLNFRKLNEAVDKEIKSISYTKPENEKGPEQHGKFNL